MQAVDQYLSRLAKRHVAALRWFESRRDTVQGWPEPLKDGTLLTTRAKGIYKPHWTHYALSVRESLTSPYPDEQPSHEADGSWRYRYFQENIDPSERDGAWTNRALLSCQEDGVPVGVMRQVGRRPARYEVLGLALVEEWADGYFVLRGFPNSAKGYPR